MAALEIIALDTATPRLRAPGTGDTYSAPRALAIAPEALTGSAATSSLSITQTWNTTGTPTALDVAVTDTASNALSRLMRFSVGGSDKLTFDKTGLLQGAGPSSGAFVIGSTTQFRPGSINIGSEIGGTSGGVVFTSSANGTSGSGAGASNLGLHIIGSASLNWQTSTMATSADLSLWRDGAADTLAQRRGTNAQTFRTYGTYTDASNYRRAAIAMTTAGVATLKAEGAGTGASGNVLHISTLPTSNPGPGILWNNAGTPAIGT